MKRCLLVKTLFLSVLILMLAGCATSAERAAQRAETAKKVAAALADRHYKIDITMMNARRGVSRHVSDFTLEVKGDTLVSYLPYFGWAYQVPYGGGKGLNFTERIGSYEEQQLKQGHERIVMQVKNEEDFYIFRLEVFDNGQVSIDVLPREREPISYLGELDLDV